MPSVTVRVLLFASARDAADGISEMNLDIGDEDNNNESAIDTALLRYQMTFSTHLYICMLTSLHND